ncbi:MAG: class I SAM-dependent methyltransferase [Candidatus Omnitrophica bacterium]|nr:class I SAM-dependent methyltransferase [Candidatus Omnitrophota bacterium]
MIYLDEMPERFDKILHWYCGQGGTTPTAPAELFQLYHWFFAIGMSMQHVYYHSKAKDRSRDYSVVELGTGLGVSSILMAKGFKDGNEYCPQKNKCLLLTVDNGNESSTQKAAQIIKLANRQFGLSIKFQIGNDMERLKSLPDWSVDALFTDANHGYADVINALDLGVPKVVMRGRIMGHDYDPVELSVPLAIEDWKAKNGQLVGGWGLINSLWWMIKR